MLYLLIMEREGILYWVHTTTKTTSAQIVKTKMRCKFFYVEMLYEILGFSKPWQKDNTNTNSALIKNFSLIPESFILSIF